jgi:oligopeptide/dipeptide ABC transporter ATP-binding protein
MTDRLLEVRNLKKYFPVRSGVLQRISGYVKAVDGVSFSVRKGETLGLVGESGCGKSTTGRAILRLIPATAGEVLFEGRDLLALHGEPLRTARRSFQMVFQDPFASLDPRMTVSQIVGEPLSAHGMTVSERERNDRVAVMLEEVGLDLSCLHRYAFEFSGGQRQRIGIARALILNPSLVVADEPVSALDVSIQAQVINLLADLRERLSLTYLFVAHDLSVVKHISDRVAVMYLGKIVEIASKNDLFSDPLHPYTQALLSAAPVPIPGAKKQRTILRGDVPSPLNPPSGCNFHPRCPRAMPQCAERVPEPRERRAGHTVACHLYD